ncbi:hypothetical protein [Solidesulfovibrio alcoholivorans]|uniref:hypothetical protein n=1 Tax=Solidesulfovibrio alcoholivorans TaxID=81406 RepID=UPI0004952F78|nr:hypothetical protein [Solidesulfovibrio alcoholivorans]
MSEIYPQSMHCRFEGFPARVRVACGRAFSEARATPYSFGSRVNLAQTPKSGVLQGACVSGQALPSLEIIYSDTGDDDVFDLKVSHYGYGRFYLPDADSTRYALAVIKGVRVEALGIRRAFETVDVWDTLLAADTDLDDVASQGATVQDADASSGVAVTWFVGDMPAGGLVVTGRLQLGGDTALLF